MAWIVDALGWNDQYDFSYGPNVRGIPHRGRLVLPRSRRGGLGDPVLLEDVRDAEETGSRSGRCWTGGVVVARQTRIRVLACRLAFSLGGVGCRVGTAGEKFAKSATGEGAVGAATTAGTSVSLTSTISI